MAAAQNVRTEAKAIAVLVAPAFTRGASAQNSVRYEPPRSSAHPAPVLAGPSEAARAAVGAGDPIYARTAAAPYHVSAAVAATAEGVPTAPGTFNEQAALAPSDQTPRRQKAGRPEPIPSACKALYPPSAARHGRYDDAKAQITSL